jgi:Uma2 family endonuclease
MLTTLPTTAAPELVPSHYEGLQMSLADFLAFEPEPDGWKYEWENGIITTHEETINQQQAGVLKRITRAFAQTAAYKQGGELLPEIDCWLKTLDVLRRPDIAYFTAEQIAAMEGGEYVTPTFVIEVVSRSDNFNRLEKKLFEYFAVGVQTVWYVNPQLRTVRVYTSPANATLCMNDDVCSAAPALSAFQMKASEIFGG